MNKRKINCKSICDISSAWTHHYFMFTKMLVTQNAWQFLLNFTYSQSMFSVDIFQLIVYVITPANSIWYTSDEKEKKKNYLIITSLFLSMNDDNAIFFFFPTRKIIFIISIDKIQQIKAIEASELKSVKNGKKKKIEKPQTF